MSIAISLLALGNIRSSHVEYLQPCWKFLIGLTLPDLTPLHNVYFVKYDVTVSFMAQVLDTVTFFVSHVLVVDTVTYFDIFR